MEYRFYTKIPPGSIYVREKIFVEEQGFQNEFDDIDEEAIHLVVYDGEDPIGAGRLYPGDAEGEYKIGRIAVLPAHRNAKLGSKILRQLEERAAEMGGKTICLSAQHSARGFYEKYGYSTEGSVYLDEHCEHINMVKKL